MLPRYLAKDGVVAVGEIGFDAMTAAEEEALTAQLALAAADELPVLVHTPHRDKLAGTRRTLELVEQSDLPEEHVLIDHNNELTVGEVHGTGCWVGFSIYPNTKMDEYRMVRILEEHGTERMLINSACDWGVSDPLKVSKTVAAMRAAGFDDDDIEQVVWRNPVEFFGQSGRLILDDLGERDLRRTFEARVRRRAGGEAASPTAACSTSRTARTSTRPTTSTSPRSWGATPPGCASAGRAGAGRRPVGRGARAADTAAAAPLALRRSGSRS